MYFDICWYTCYIPTPLRLTHLICPFDSNRNICNYSDFSLSPGCFGTEIIKNCTKWSNIGVHGLSFGPIEAEFQGASFLFEKIMKNDNLVQKNIKILFFFEKKSLRSKMPHLKSVKNQKFRQAPLKSN